MLLAIQRGTSNAGSHQEATRGESFCYQKQWISCFIHAYIYILISGGHRVKTDSVIEWGWGGGEEPLSKALGDLLIDWAPVPAVVTARLGDGHTLENESELACSWVVRLDSLVCPQIDLIQAHWPNGTRAIQACCMTCTGHRNAGRWRACCCV